MALSRSWSLKQFCTLKDTLFLNIKGPYFKNVSRRSFRREKIEGGSHNVDPTINFPFNNTLNGKSLWRPFLFTIGFSGSCYVGAVIWEYESMRAHAISKIKKPLKLFKKQFGQIQDKSISIKKDIINKWNSLTPGEKVFLPICAINVIVFGAWRINHFQPFMIKYFSSNPGSKSIYWPMLLSTFSHYSGLHLLANMYVLHSFSTGAVNSLGKEQFLGLYLSAGVISSFSSYLYKVVTKQSGMSLGASGAIMTILGYVCTQFPDTRLGIILIPYFTFTAGTAIKSILALDAAGVLLGWKFFDHAAHLGGAVFGIFWAIWGRKHIWEKREPIVQYWHEFRGSIK